MRRAAEMAKGFIFSLDRADDEEEGEWENADQGRIVFDRVTERAPLVEAPVPVPYRAKINCAACGHRWIGRITREEGGR